MLNKIKVKEMKVEVRNLFVDVRKVAVVILCMLLVGFVTVRCDKFRWGKRAKNSITFVH